MTQKILDFRFLLSVELKLEPPISPLFFPMTLPQSELDLHRGRSSNRFPQLGVPKRFLKKEGKGRGVGPNSFHHLDD